MVKPIVAVAAIAALVGGSYLLLRQSPPAAGPSTGSPVAATSPPGTEDATTITPAASVTPAVGPGNNAPAGPQQPELVAGTIQQHPDWISFPDGTAYPPLNGVTKAPPVVWHKMLPFSKVLRIERDRQGRDWYVHENGARSTTYLDQRGVAVSDIAMDKPTMPILDDTAPK